MLGQQGIVLSYIKLIPLDILQVQRNRVFSGFLAIDIADSMGRQVHLTFLLVWKLVLPSNSSSVCQRRDTGRAKAAETRLEARTRRTGQQLTPHRAPHCPGQR